VSLPGTAFLAAVDALGDRFAAPVLGTPSGCTAVRGVYPVSLKAATTLPAVVLEVQDGSVVADAGQWRHTWNVDVLLILAKRPADPQRIETMRQRYLPYLLGATEGKMKLGLGSQAGWELKSALPASWEWTEYAVADVGYDGIRVSYQLIAYETVSLVP
jgi:hypothetical protein